MSLAEWSVNNRVAVNLLAIVLLVSGILAAGTRLKLDLFPDVTTNFIQVATLDPTTSIAEEIERTITVPIEEELGNVKGVERIRSFSEDNFSTIFIEIDPSITNLDPVLNEVRQAVDKARPKLPGTIEPPIIEIFDIPFPLITFTVSFPPGYDTMKARPELERIKRRLRIAPGVGDVFADGLDRREVWVEVDPFRLQALGISFEELTQAVARKNVNVVGGRMDAAGGQRMVRLLGEIRAASELAEVPVKEVDGRVVLLRDIAVFKDTTEEPRTLGRANLRPAITYTVVKKRGADAIKTAGECRRIFAEEAALLPPEIETQVLNDTTRFIRTRINTVLQNGAQALILVTVLLLLLLNWRLALVVAVGIPISFAGTMLVLYIGGYSINLLSLFAMIMALGLVVDDAIVIAENAYRYLEKGFPPAVAAVRGAREVIWPVVGSVSTSVAAFLPLIWAEGLIGKFLLIVPVVVISTLVFSLVQAFIILPSHMCDFVRVGWSAKELADSKRRGPAHWIALTYAEMRETVDGFLKRVIDIYTYFLKVCLRQRYLAILGFILILLAMVGGLATGLVPFRLFAGDFADIIFVKAELPADYSLQQTADVLERLEAKILNVLPQDDFLALITRIGARFDPTEQFLEYGTNLAMVTVDLDEDNPGARLPSQVARDLRRMLSEFPEFVNAEVQVREGGPPVGREVNVEIVGPDFATLLELAEQIERRLALVDGVVTPTNDFPRGKTEFQVIVDEPRAARAGLDVAAVARNLQAGFRGLEAGRMRWGNEEVILRVKAAERFRQDPELLNAYRIINRRGEAVDISSVADIRRTTGIARIKRLNQERVITVSADVDERASTSAAVNREIARWIPELIEEHPGYAIYLTGENEDTARSLESMGFAAIVALLLIYALLAVITNSFAQPLVIMSVIPFGLVGVVLGLIFMGQPIGLMALMGTIALAGIVVNNCVVFVDFINQYRHRAASDSGHHSRHQPLHLPKWVRWRSIMDSARTRFRPVFLTTATTVAGLSSLAFVTRGQEQFLAPMAQAIIFGLTFASLITMILIPCLYSVLDDLHALIRRPRKTPPIKPMTPTAAELSAPRS